MNIFYLEILKEVDINNIEQIKILHKLGEYKPNNQIVDEEDTQENKKNEIDEILNEHDEDDFNNFEELDEDLY